VNPCSTFRDWQNQKADLLESFDLNGFVFLPGFLSGNTLQELQSQLQDFIQTKLPDLPGDQVYYEHKNDPHTLKQIQRIFEYDDGFRSLIFESEFQQLSDLLLGPNSIGKNLQYFNKPPGIGQPTPPHQDGYYFMLEPCNAITMWLALDDVNTENGCVRYIPRSHKQGMRSHNRTKTLGFSQGISDYDERDSEQELFFTLSPGDLLVHHALTIHRADGNTSPTRQRRALGFIYYGANAKVDRERHEAYQAQLSRDLTAEGKI
jgi:phytanoyl-CoA hydroxylase